jgi:stringent starvation protein B
MDSGLPPPRSKREGLETLLARGLVMIHLDARRPEVVVPEYLSRDPHLCLNLSYRFGLPDLEIDDWGVRATLSFRGQGFHCRIPWTALFAMTQGGGERGWLWPHDLPAELLDAMKAAAPGSTWPSRTERGLHLVPLEEGAADGNPDPEPSGGASGQGSPPPLRLVK